MPVKITLFFVFHLLCAQLVWGQQPARVDTFQGVYFLQTVIVDGDTIPMVTLRTANISSFRRARSQRYQRKWTKLHANVIKTYPYAKVAGDLIQAYSEQIAELPTQAEKDAYLSKCEEDLKAEFEGDLRKMTTSQGRVLIKLIDRETGKTSYDLIKELRSGFTAFMWQSVAKIFGTDLKSAYDPDSDEYDAMIEEVVTMIEQGEIQVAVREVKTKSAAEALRDKSKRLERRIEKEQNRLDKKKGSGA